MDVTVWFSDDIVAMLESTDWTFWDPVTNWFGHWVVNWLELTSQQLGWLFWKEMEEERPTSVCLDENTEEEHSLDDERLLSKRLKIEFDELTEFLDTKLIDMLVGDGIKCLDEDLDTFCDVAERNAWEGSGPVAGTHSFPSDSEVSGALLDRKFK